MNRVSASGAPRYYVRPDGITAIVQHGPAAADDNRQRVETERAAALAPAVGLTRREHEVALLLARGLTNRELAQDLVIEVKTVKNHVQRVLEKIGVRSRGQLIARAHELGLAQPLPPADAARTLTRRG
jgi:DNA-binding NarL/FixJ family response regulator